MRLRTKLAAAAATIAVTAGMLTLPATADLSKVRWAKGQTAKAAATGNCTLYGSGCLGDWSSYAHGIDGNPATSDILVVGDSIVTKCRTYLRKRLTPYNLTVTFDYWSSRPTADIPSVSSSPGAVTRMLSYSRIHQPESFKAVVMLTGTNDIFDPSTMAANITRAKAIDSPLLWGSAYVARTNTYAADLRNTGWVNAAIYGSGLPVSDWYAFLAAYPGYRIPNHVPDGRHPDYGTGNLGDGSGCDAWAAIHAPRIAAVAG